MNALASLARMSAMGLAYREPPTISNSGPYSATSKQIWSGHTHCKCGVRISQNKPSCRACLDIKEGRAAA